MRVLLTAQLLVGAVGLNGNSAPGALALRAPRSPRPLHVSRLPLCAGAAPLLRPSLRIGARCAVPVVAEERSARPPLPLTGPAVILSAGGLTATLLTSASALSRTGMAATLAASAAGLFTFKLAKELSYRGVGRGTFLRIAAGSAQFALRATLTAGSALAYALASLVSVIVWTLTRLGETVLYIAELANQLNPEGRLPPSEYGTAADQGLVSPPEPATTAGAAPPMGGVPPAAVAAAATARGARMPARSPPPPPPPASEPSAADDREHARQLAVQQMLERSSKAAAAARRIEAEKAEVLQSRQDQAVRKAYEQRQAGVSESTAMHHS